MAAVRRGQALRAVARQFKVCLFAVQHWVKRAGHQPLGQVAWEDRSHRPQRSAHQTAPAFQRRILALRRQLARGALGLVGAQAIYDALYAQKVRPLPCVRTIGRILKRHGVLDCPRRVRRGAPPPGWHLPDVAARRAELEHFDVIEDLALEGGPLLDVLTARALHGAACGAWPGSAALTTNTVLEALAAHWRCHGLPHYAQFDNDMRFQGTHRHAESLGRVIRFCLALGVTPVFAPPAEHGFQNPAESFNALWQQKVWHRFHHESLAALVRRSDRFVAAYEQRRAARHAEAAARRPFPKRWHFDPKAPLHGQLIFIRRTDGWGAVRLLGRCWPLDPQWPHRLVRAEVDLDAHCIRFYRLRRRAPEEQPLLKTVRYRWPGHDH